MLRIDALLGRGGQLDGSAAAMLAQTISDDNLVQSTLGWSYCPALALARVSARLRDPASERLLMRALNFVEENAHRTPLDADRAFSSLAAAAAEVGAERICQRARARRDYFRTLRAAAAGTAWGGERLSRASTI